MRVLIAEKSLTARSRLVDRITAAPGARVIASVEDLSATYHIAEHKVPNLVLVGTSLAQQPEFEVLCLLFRALSIRCVLLSGAASISARERDLAVRCGLEVRPANLSATDFLSKPVQGRAIQKTAKDTCKEDPACAFDGGLILIGASTGGVDALIRVLTAFPEACPPTLIVQHTGPQFTSGLAKLVDGHVSPSVSEARPGMRPSAGQVLIAPGGDQHLILKRAGESVTCGFNSADPVQGHRPSVDKLFGSAVPVANRVAAALLTGMGRDGADGLLALRRAGAQTFGQDEKSSVVFGMPRAAFELGAVGKQLPIDAIGPALLRARRRAP